MPILNCKNCNKEFRVVPSSNNIFCSFRCYRSFQGETSIEKKVRLALEKLNIEFIQEYKIERRLVDFAIPDRKIIIEADGKYWHDVEKDKKKDKMLSGKGWKIIRLSEDFINQCENLHEVIYGKLIMITTTQLQESRNIYN